ncbi:G-protein coupled receptor activity protein [Homalodisca vitripennis]|nr:G-protein coupled receptor activity protein [Homalodisca vitripennis]
MADIQQGRLVPRSGLPQLCVLFLERLADCYRYAISGTYLLIACRQVFNKDGWCQGLVYLSTVCSFLSVWLIVIVMQYLVFNKDGWCQGLVYLSSVCSFLSVWLIVIVMQYLVFNKDGWCQGLVYLSSVCCFLSVWLIVIVMQYLVFNKDGWCQGLVYLSSVCSFLSVWLIVAFTVERFIAVQYPLHRPHMCTVARAKTIVMSLTLVALVSHAYSFVTAGINVQGVCDLREGYHETMRVINIIDSFLTLIVPLALIIVMNTMITRNLIRFSRRFKQQGSECNDRSDFVLHPLHYMT